MKIILGCFYVLPEVLSHAGYNDWIRRGISRKVNPLNGPDSCWTVWSYCPKPLKDQSHACNRKEKGAFFKGYFHLLHHFYRTIFKRDDTVNGIGQQSSKQCSICLLKKITLNKVKAEFFLMENTLCLDWCNGSVTVLFPKASSIFGHLINS